MKTKPKNPKQLTCQPFHLAKIAFDIKANTAAYIWKKLLTVAVQLITQYYGMWMTVRW